MGQLEETPEEKSKRSAQLIEMAKLYLLQIDENHLESVSTQLHTQASRQESMSIINMHYYPEKTQILRAQAGALGALLSFISHLKEIDQLKKTLDKAKQGREQIDRLFL